MSYKITGPREAMPKALISAGSPSNPPATHAPHQTLDVTGPWKLTPDGATCLQMNLRRLVLGSNFRKPQNKIQTPPKLERLIKMIDNKQWPTLPADIKHWTRQYHPMRNVK